VRPPQFSAEKIRAVRTHLKLSQPVFAGILNVSGSTVRAWENGMREPEGPSLRLLELAEKHPEMLLANLAQTRGSSKNPKREKP